MNKNKSKCITCNNRLLTNTVIYITIIAPLLMPMVSALNLEHSAEQIRLIQN